MSLHVSYSKSYNAKEDSELWSELKSGDREALSLIYYKNAKPLIDYALKITSDKKLIEDCIQDLFIDLWNNRLKLGNVQMIRHYLFTALRRRVIKSLKQKKLLFSFDEVQTPAHFELPLEGTMILNQDNLEKKEKLHQALKKLSPLQKEIIYLKYFGDFSFDEIAQILKTTKKTIYNALSKAMIKLRKYLSGSAITFFLIAILQSFVN